MKKPDSIPPAFCTPPAAVKHFPRIALFLAFALLASGRLCAQENDAVAALEAKLAGHTASDTLRYQMLDDLAWELRSSNSAKALVYCNEALEIAIVLGDKTKKAGSLNMLGVIYQNQGKYAEAVQHYQDALETVKETGNKRGIASLLANIGSVYSQQGYYSKALEMHLEALKTREEIQDKRGLANTYNDLGIVYKSQKDYPEALKYYFKAIEIEQELNDNLGVTDNFNNVGNVYLELDNTDSAMWYYSVAIQIREDLGYKRGLASSFLNMGLLHKKKNEPEKALGYYNASLSIASQIGDMAALSLAYSSIGELYLADKRYATARQHLEKGLAIASEIGAKDKEMEILGHLAKLYEETAANDPEKLRKSIGFMRKSQALKDSLFSLESFQQIAQLQSGYEMEKKEKENELLRKEQALQEDRIKRQGITATAVTVILVLVIILAVVLYRLNKNTTKTNSLLLEKNEELKSQQEEIASINEQLRSANLEVQRKNQDMLSSISYAKNIQQAIMPNPRKLAQIFGDSFIFLKPRDIVSGDFYWFTETPPRPVYEEGSGFDNIGRIFKEFEPGVKLIAAVDCTGHGVPGAFMSMIGLEQLTETVNLKGISHPDLVLAEMHKEVKFILKKQETHNFDCMDMAVCTYDQEKKELIYAGARLPLIYVQEGPDGPELHEIKPDKMSVGASENYGLEAFTPHTITIDRPTACYLFSDGYQDQFGGEAGKKFMVRRLRELLLEIFPLPMDQQRTIVKQTMAKWMAGNEQVDDMLVMGFKL